MRQEANFWNSQSNRFHIWPDIKETYGSAIISMPLFPSGQLNDYTSSTTPSIHANVFMTEVNLYPKYLIDANAYQLLSRMLSPIPNMCHKPRNECRRLLPIYENCG